MGSLRLNAKENSQKATFAGGCFWCMEPPFEQLDGVTKVISGYTGGRKKNPTYEEVCSGSTGHLEAIQVTYDSSKTSYAELLDIFWRSVDPTDAVGQFADKGTQYQTAIFYHAEEQRKLAEMSKQELAHSGKFDQPIVTQIRPAGEFYPAEEYHQGYYLKNPEHYKSYKYGSGREPYLKKMWRNQERACPLLLRNTGTKESSSNRLIHEKSPYLLQHAHNPVDWYPWGGEAFDKARKEDKPIFLSIGYSTCHWCHVMEEESFENQEVAKIMNENFVSIKVDREERPDLDQIYMQAVTAMTGSGGWPMSVFLTPDGHPFYGGTYFPPEDRWGRPGFKSLLLSIAAAWKNNRQELIQSSAELVRAFRQQQEPATSASLTKETLDTAYQQLRGAFDSRYGGFGPAPKFPHSHTLSFLLRYWKRTHDAQALAMTEKTLQEMAKGGMYDQIGGGFHRYSTDERWFVPHFEKMLYDQAILSKSYLEAYQATHNPEYARVAREVLDYVLRDMTNSSGGFYSAEDADSAPDAAHPGKKREGAFYVWDDEEIFHLLGPESAKIVSVFYGIEKEGNVTQDPQGEFTGKNILYQRLALETLTSQSRKSPQEIEKILGDAKEKLLIARGKRPRPHLDDKILTDWNGLMISSFSFASRVLEEPQYLEAARKAADFILNKMKRSDGRLLHRYRDGEAAIPGYIEDYAFFIHGLIDLYEAGFDPDYLGQAKQLCSEMIRLFWDPANGGFYLTGSDAEALILRPMEIYDGAVPAGNSVAALDLIRLGRLMMEKEFEQKADLLLKAFSNEVSQSPSSYSQLLIALDFTLGPSKEIVIAGDIQAEGTADALRSLYQTFTPNKVVVFRPDKKDEAKAKKMISLVPFLKERRAIDGKTTLYICENYACKTPLTDPQRIKEELQ